jgi:mgtE-like transporter
MARGARTRRAALAPARQVRRLVDFLGPTSGAAQQSLIALAFNSTTSFVAGLVLVSITGTFQRLPGMLVLVPAAIGLRGNVFSTLGNRLSTSIHTGTFRVSFRRDSVLAQNLWASFCLTMAMSVVLAAVAKIVAVAVGTVATISVWDLVTISVIGGVLGSIPVALATIALTLGAVRYDWDLDNLVAPTVSTLGDVVTIPALWLAAEMIGDGLGRGTFWTAVVLIAVTAVLTVGAWRARAEILRQIVRESFPVLIVAIVLSTLAGMVLQSQVDILEALPTLFLMQPAFVSSAGALGGILAGRVATNLHLGVVEPTLVPGREVRRDTSFLFGIAAPVFLFNAVGAYVVSSWQGPTAPALGWTVLTCVLAATFTMAFVVAVGYYATIGAWRVEVDPDSYGTPVVTSAVDFVGTMALVFTAITLGLT